MRFRVLGPLEASERGPVRLGGRRQKMLLAHLVLHVNEFVSSDRLIEGLWGESLPAAPRRDLQSYVSRLRKSLGDPDRVEGGPGGYMLRADPPEVDYLEFELLVEKARRELDPNPQGAAELLDQALDLWKGPPLADLADEISLYPEITRLEELRLSAVERRIEARLALGLHGELVSELEGLVGTHPLRERFWGQLMLALYRSGRQGDALGAYRRARDVLVEELGVDPSPQLQRLEDLVLRQDPELELGARPLRGYELIEKIGEGHFGVVYRARQPNVGREVAVKVIQPRLADHREFIRRFEAEAQLVARLEHPHIVPLYDYWREPGAAYLVMRLLRRGSLQKALTGGPLRTDQAVRLLDQVASALSAAHRQGVVHRDVKPANILLDDEHNAYLSDFGIARDVTGNGELIAGIGTSGYLSPEQIRGEPPTPRSDLYSLGVVIYEMLTGEHPFAGVDAEALAEFQVHEPLPSVEDILAGPSSGLDLVIQRATAKDPADRYPDADTLAGEFRRFLRAPSPPTLPAVRNPYKGLRPFLEADAIDFFGRESLVRRLLTGLSQSRFLTLIGPSGSGKSSVVRAGLVPALRRGDLPGSEKWLLTEMVPGRHPFRELEAALLRVAVDPPPELVHESDDRAILEMVAAVLPPESELLLILDQFEEVFTLVEDEELRKSFLRSLVLASTNPAGRVRVVATLRADFYDRPLRWRELAELLRSGTELVVPMAPDELERAIHKPAQHQGVAIEPRAVAEMVADVVDQPGALPLLQFTLAELFDRRDDSTIGLSTYRSVGGVTGALVRRAEELYTSLDPDGREAARQLYLRLVVPGEGTEDTRRRVTRTELTGVAGADQTMDSVIEAFGRHRLLSFDRDPETRLPTVEVAHEALLQAWGRLRGWIDAAREDIRMQRRLASATHEWASSGKDPSFLARGSRLDQFENWAKKGALYLSAPEQEYLRASLAARSAEVAVEEARAERERTLERRSVVRLRALVAALGLAALVAGALSIAALTQSRRAAAEARLATARQLAAAGVANLGVDPELSILLALEAVETTRSVDGSVLREAEEALHQALVTSRVTQAIPDGPAVTYGPEGRLVSAGPDAILTVRDPQSGEALLELSGHAAPVLAIAVSRQGGRIASVGQDNTAKVWDANTGQLVGSVTHPGLRRVALSPDGRLVAATADDQMARVWRVDTGEEVVSVGPHPEAATGVAFSPDGTSIAVGVQGDGSAQLWEIPSGRQAQHLCCHDFTVNDVAFSPDGELLATASSDSKAKVWDVETGEQIATLLGHTGIVNGVDMASEGLIATGSADGTAKVWQLTDEGPRQLVSLAGHRRAVTSVSLSPTGRELATGSEDGTTRIWEIAPEGSRELLTLPGTDTWTGDVAYSPDGSLVAASGNDGLLQVRDAQTGDELVTVRGSEAPVFAIAFHPDGDVVAAAGADGLRVWSIPDGSPVRSLLMVGDDWFDSPPGWVLDATFSPGGDLLASITGEGTITLWNTGTWESISTLSVYGFGFSGSLSFSPEGSLLATAGSTSTARILDPASREVVGSLRGHEAPLNQAAFSPGGSQVVTASFDGSARVWDVISEEERFALLGHTGFVWSAVFSPDGTLMATAGDDGLIKLWDADSGQEQLTLQSHQGAVYQLAFSPDSRHLASSSLDGTVRIHVLPIEELVELARERVTRSLTGEECQRHLHVESCPEA